MADITVGMPHVGKHAYFSFKEPFATQVRTILGTDDVFLELDIESVVSMVDFITKFHRDPYVSIYNAVGLSEVEYKQDLHDEIPIITFAYTNSYAQKILFKVPHNYIAEQYDPGSIVYEDRVLVISLGSLPRLLDIEGIYDDVADFIATRVGVEPVVKDVSTGNPVFLDAEEHDLREEIRKNNATVNKTLAMENEELRTALADLHERLNDMGISLAE